MQSAPCVAQNVSNAEIAQIRTQMLKFANLQLKNPDIAEDIVQEALLSALKNQQQFKRQAALKTWIFAILKNKIIDNLRTQSRYLLVSELTAAQEDDHFFDSQDHWRAEFSRQSILTTEKQLDEKRFWMKFEACLTHLPAKQAQAFMMREYLEFSTEEICQQMELSRNHLYLLLYRARLQLQHCLTQSTKGQLK